MSPREPDTHLKNGEKSPKSSVLIIDDCPDSLEINRMTLEMEGYKVTTAESGVEALALLSRTPRPDLILLDVKMQEMSGPEFLAALECTSPKTLAQVPIIFFSSVDDIPESQASGFIQKPVSIDKFIAAVRHYIDKGVSKGRYRH